jgi:exopolysaccharide biosynthesis protein
VPTPTPDPDAAFYSESGEVVEVNPDGRHWSYKSPTLGVSIERIDDKKRKIAPYIADIHVRDFSLIASGFANKKPQGSPRQTPEDITRLYKAVFAQNGDYYTHAAASVGLAIRGGVVYRDKKQKDDVMAFSPDGEMLVFHPGKTTAKKLQALGVTDTYNFGPILVEDGKVGTLKNSHSIAGVNPRSGIGMVKPGHYVGIVVDAGTPERRSGLKLKDFAQLFVDRGCTVAYNFDGGQSTSMVFMGNAINTPLKHLDGKNWNGQRKVPDIFRIGESELVPYKTK